MKKIKVRIKEIIRIMPGGFYPECNTNVGIVKKEAKNVPQKIWDKFEGTYVSWWQRLVLFIKKILKR